MAVDIKYIWQELRDYFDINEKKYTVITLINNIMDE